MKSPFTIIAMLFAAVSCNASAGFMGKEDMIHDADIIAIVDIQELISTDTTKAQVTLIAHAGIAQVIKGQDILVEHIKTSQDRKLEFKIPKFFPCAMFDVSTGRHIVFLRKTENELLGSNWERSYVYISKGTGLWYNENEMSLIEMPVDEILRDIESVIGSNGETAN